MITKTRKIWCTRKGSSKTLVKVSEQGTELMSQYNPPHPPPHPVAIHFCVQCIPGRPLCGVLYVIMYVPGDRGKDELLLERLFWCPDGAWAQNQSKTRKGPTWLVEGLSASPPGCREGFCGPWLQWRGTELLLASASIPPMPASLPVTPNCLGVNGSGMS